MSAKGCLLKLLISIMLPAIAVVLFLNRTSGFLNFAPGSLKPSSELVEAMEELNRKYEFEAPKDGRISESQLQMYLSVKSRVSGPMKPHEEVLDLLTDSERRIEDDKTFDELSEVLNEVQGRLLETLQEHQMSLAEYRYISEQVHRQYLAEEGLSDLEVPSKPLDINQELLQLQQELTSPNLPKGVRDLLSESFQEAENSLPPASDQLTDMENQLIAGFSEVEKILENPSIPPEIRKMLRESYDNIKKNMEKSDGIELQIKEAYKMLPKESIEILDKYRTQLEKLDTKGIEYWGLFE